MNGSKKEKELNAQLEELESVDTEEEDILVVEERSRSRSPPGASSSLGATGRRTVPFLLHVILNIHFPNLALWGS